jgi:hypothetical protein
VGRKVLAAAVECLGFLMSVHFDRVSLEPG